MRELLVVWCEMALEYRLFGMRLGGHFVAMLNHSEMAIRPRNEIEEMQSSLDKLSIRT